MTYTLDFVIIVAFFIGILGIGVYAAKTIKDHADFTIAGRKIKLPVLFGTIVGTAIGAGSTMGTAGMAYEHGIIVIVIVGYTIGLAIFSYVGPIIHSTGVWNMPAAPDLCISSIKENKR